MVKIAVKTPALPTSPECREIASGEGWSVCNMICTSGPLDRPFEERHARPAIAVVTAGTFQYRTGVGSDLMLPGAFLLGNAGEYFTCGHEHGHGDRCVSFAYDPAFYERLAHDAAGASLSFQSPSLPPLRLLASLAAKCSALPAAADSGECGELAIQLAARALQTASGLAPRKRGAQPSAVRRVTQVVRMIENDAAMPADLTGLARIARLSPYYFLRTFQEIAGTTPHQYLLRMRLRQAFIRIVSEKRTIAEIALDCGFGDISNFNRAFRAEFCMSPRACRHTA